MLTSIASLSRMAAVAGLALLPMTAKANEIILTSPDNTVRLVGQYVGFEVDTYVITINGIEMRVSAARMNCAGANCLNFEPVATADASG